MHFSIRARPAVTDEIRELAEDAGDDRLVEELRPLERTTLVGRFDAQTRVREATRSRSPSISARCTFFDPSTGEAIADRASARADLCSAGG
jgi:multiple sugar transport system ATP-binding protein